MLLERDSLLKENDNLKSEKVSLLRNKDLADAQVMALTRSLEVLQKDLKDKEIQVQDFKQSLECQRKELNGCRAEITSLKMHIEGSRYGKSLVSNDTEHAQSESLESYKEEIKLLQKEIESLKAGKSFPMESIKSIDLDTKLKETEDGVHSHENNSSAASVGMASGVLETLSVQSVSNQMSDDTNGETESLRGETLSSSSKDDNWAIENSELGHRHNGESVEGSDGVVREPTPDKIGLETIQILSDALPKIVPYVLINHREELLPLMMCAIERHPNSGTRDSLTHTLFNLIKRPDEQQRRIIMEACVTLAKNVGEMRTETELLPQCWEQINHMYEERRLLVAQSCGELAEFVRPEIRDSLILSIVQQLIEDSATVVREAAAHNLALLLPLFPNTDKYFKVSLTKYASRQSWRRNLT